MTKDQNELLNIIVGKLAEAHAQLGSLREELEQETNNLSEEDAQELQDTVIDYMEQAEGEIDSALMNLNGIEDDEDETS